MDRRRGDVFGNERNALYISHKGEKKKIGMKMPKFRKIKVKKKKNRGQNRNRKRNLK